MIKGAVSPEPVGTAPVVVKRHALDAAVLCALLSHSGQPRGCVCTGVATHTSSALCCHVRAAAASLGHRTFSAPL